MSLDNGKHRGILRHKAGERKFRLARYLPAQDLSLFVEFYWSVTWDLRGQEPYAQEVLPYPSVHLVFEKGQTQIFGVMTGRFTRLLENAGRVFSVKFRPGGFYPFVRRPVSTFTNATLSCQDAFGVDDRALEEAVLALEDEGAMQVVEDFLRTRLPEEDERVKEVNCIVDYIIAHPEIIKVDDVLSHFDLNKRALQRLFNQYVGVSPKWVIKRYRLHEAVERLAASQTVDGTEIAQDLGYFDQAHFIKDFKAIIGKTPREYAHEL
ncbi:MAG: helix-turn-helix transcriptional regulator [Ktedonobacteraceae bacterium]|nr:helix-turn-helix transcriptional regulator [Ktedonobacteraceae bacterium]